MLGDLELRIGVKLADGGKVDITAQDGDAHRFLRCEVLEVLNEPCPLQLVVLGRPVIVQIVEDLNAAVELIQESAKQPSAAERFDRIHHATG